MTTNVEAIRRLFQVEASNDPAFGTTGVKLREALGSLAADHDFLLKGDVFTRDFIENWIDLKKKEYDALRLRPHPYEFSLYYDI